MIHAVMHKWKLDNLSSIGLLLKIPTLFVSLLGPDLLAYNLNWRN